MGWFTFIFQMILGYSLALIVFHLGDIKSLYMIFEQKLNKINDNYILKYFYKEKKLRI